MRKTPWSIAMPVVKSCGIHFHTVGTTIPQAWFAKIPDFDLWVTLSGRGVAHVPNGPSVSMTRGSCLWITPGDVYDFEILEPLSHVWIHFDLLDEDGDLLDYLSVETPPKFAEIPNTHFIEQVARRIVLLRQQYRHAPGRRADLATSSSAYFLKALLMEFQYAQELSKLSHSQGVAQHLHAIVSDALSWIYGEPEVALSPALVARRYNYSLKYFSKVFRQICGKTLSEAIIESRIDRACALLSNSSLNIAQIALRLGYEDPFYFSRQFKKAVGQSPIQFRQRHYPPEIKTP